MNEQMPGNGTQFVPAKCTNCGGELTVDPSQETAVCQYCGASFVVSKAVQNYNVTHNSYTTNVINDNRKSAFEAMLDYRNEQEERKYRIAEENRKRRESEKKKRNHTILWVLGWIFIFPVPLTILMLRKKDLDNKIKYGIIAAGWIVYIIMLAVSGGNGSSSSEDSSSAQTQSAVSVVQSADDNDSKPDSSQAQSTASPDSEPDSSKSESKSESKEDKKDKDKEEDKDSNKDKDSEAPETSESSSEQSEDDVRKAVNNGDYSLVTPEFKELMDSYESFYDKYIEFMNKYSSGEMDVMEMMTDYADMLSQMEEWSDKVDQIDETELSPADDAYYLLVTLRIEQKLVGAVY